MWLLTAIHLQRLRLSLSHRYKPWKRPEDTALFVANRHELVYGLIMFEALAEAIDNLVIPAQSEALREVFQLHGRLSAKATTAAAAFDHDKTFELDGSASMTAWMRVHLDMTNHAANRILRTGRRLRELPVTADAWEAGRLSSGQIEIIVDNVKSRHAFLFARHEADLVPAFANLDVVQTVTAMREWVARADADIDPPEPPEEPAAEVRLAASLDGRGYLNGTFDAEGTAILTKGLELAARPDTPSEDPRSWAQRQGEAMVDVFRFFLDHQADKLGKRHRPHVNVTIGLPDLLGGGPGRTLAGAPLSAATMSALLCDANVHRVITDGASSILDYGRSTRTIPPAVYTSLVLRDGGCRFPGCDRPPAWCDGHHVQHWEHGGATNLQNLCLLCSKHHHLIHTPGWHLKLRPDGTVEATHPDGRTTTSDPPLLC